MSITDERAEDDDGGEARTARCPNVLIVDDHELLSTTMELALRAQGIAAVRAPVLGADAVRRSAPTWPPAWSCSTSTWGPARRGSRWTASRWRGSSTPTAGWC